MFLGFRSWWGLGGNVRGREWILEGRGEGGRRINLWLLEGQKLQFNQGVFSFLANQNW